MRMLMFESHIVIELILVKPERVAYELNIVRFYNWVS